MGITYQVVERMWEENGCNAYCIFEHGDIEEAIKYAKWHEEEVVSKYRHSNADVEIHVSY